MTLLGIILSIILFFASIILHEIVHYLTILYFGGTAKFIWLHKGTFSKIGNPGVRGKGVTPKDQIIVSLSPIPLGLVINTIIFVALTYDMVPSAKTTIWLLLCFIFSIFATYASSSTDIKDAIKIYKEINTP